MKSLYSRSVLTAGAFIVMLLAGCIPITKSYYKPYAPVGKVTNYACDGSGGAPDELHINRDGIIIDIFADSYPREDIAGVGLIVPKNKILYTDLTSIELVNKDRHNMDTLINSATLYVKLNNNGVYKKMQISKVLKGDLYASESRGSSWYSYILKLDHDTLPKTFYMMFPAMTLGNKRYPAFSVKFNRTRGTFLTPINGC